MSKVKPVPAASAAVWRSDEVLVVTRGRAPNAGLWALPGGRVEPSETLAQAALREVQEETGIVCKIGPVLQQRVLAGSNYTYHLTTFSATWVSGEPQAGDDAAEARFVAPDRLNHMACVEGLVDMLNAGPADRP